MFGLLEPGNADIARCATRNRQPATSTAGIARTDKNGGEAVFTVKAALTNLDPAIQLPYSFTASPVMNAIYGNLMYEITESGRLSMGFLQSFTPNNDGSVWTAVLRPGLKFSDGTAFDAAAIAYNITRDAEDKDKAQKLFNELAAEGMPVDFSYVEYAQSPDAVNGANLLAAQLGKYKNVKITLKPEPTQQAISDVHTGKFQTGTDSIYIENLIPDLTRFSTGGSAVEGAGGGN